MARVALLLMIAAALALAACGEDDAESLSADEVATEFERLADDIVEPAEGAGGEPLATEVECEDASEENYFDCTGTIAGQESEFQLVVEGNTIDVVPPKDRVPPAD